MTSKYNKRQGERYQYKPSTITPEMTVDEVAELLEVHGLRVDSIRRRVGTATEARAGLTTVWVAELRFTSDDGKVGGSIGRGLAPSYALQDALVGWLEYIARPACTCGELAGDYSYSRHEDKAAGHDIDCPKHEPLTFEELDDITSGPQ